MGRFNARVARVVTATAAAAVMVLLPMEPVTSPASASAPVKPHTFVPPKPQQVKVLARAEAAASAGAAGARLRVSKAALGALRAGGARADSAWPSPGSGTAVLPGLPAGATAAALRAGSAPVTAGGLPVTVARDGRAAGGLSRVGVSVLSHAAAERAGVTGLLLTLHGTGAGSGTVDFALRYGAFRNAGGADFGDRLRLVELPACAVTTPLVPACQVQTPLRSVNDAGAARVSAAVRLAPSAAASAVTPAVAGGQAVVAAVAGASGSNGNFSATSLSPAGSWVAGGSSGDFTWSYPITLPPPAAGKAPPVSLSYDSATVDGRTAQTNNQSGMVGEGFSLDQNYIERSYTDCADDPEGAISGDYDSCWAGNVVSLSLDGHSTQLVLDSSGNWHEESDTGDQVQYLKGTAADTGNGTYDNGYWLVTTPNGTQYYFGKNKGPGWASGDPVTNSAWTEPVYGAHSGDPCYSSSGFADSSCTQAWRWNLDFVIDPNGNAAAYYYTPETNYYGADNGTTGVEYDRGGYLSKIEYGLRDESGSIYAPAADANPADEVVFGTAQRCIPTSSFSCSASDFTTANAADWPDTPVDQLCTASQVCNNHAPTFWSQLRIDSITTQYYNGSGYTKVDSYALGQSFPSSGDPELELDTITRTGYSSSGSSLSLPPVDLTYQLMDNRIPGYNSEPSMSHWRLTNIETETGELISVTYSTGCTSSDIPSDPSSNTTLCYPIYWTPFGDTSPILDYFNKYVVREVSVQDGMTTGPDPSEVTEYTYVGSPAWHYDDNQVVKAKDRTYGQFRGYGTVQVLTGNPQNTTNGAADVQTETETTYYQGMDGDTLPGGGTSSVTVKDSLGETFTDTNALGGLPLEVQTFDGAGGAQVSDKITEWQVTAVTGTQTVSGLPELKASMTGITSERDITDLAGGGTQTLTTDTSYDSDGRPILVDKSGTGITETCTQTSYDDNTSAWIMDAVSEVTTAQQACPSAGTSLTAADIISATRTYYDGATSTTTAPTVGNPTEQDSAVTNSSGTLTWQMQWQKGYDSSGRVQSVTDARKYTTNLTYTPSDGGPLTEVETTNALSQSSTQTFDPGRGSVLTSTDVANYETSYAYDPLGRVTAIWKPGRSQSAGDSANITYSYQVAQGKPLAVTANTLVDYGTGTDYVTSVSLYDSLGNLRQTQTAAEGGNTAVTDKFYDSHGWVWQTYNKYVVSGAPSTTLVQEAASAVNDRTVLSFDGLGRTVDARDYNGDTLTDSTQTVYGGDQTTAIRHDASGNDVGTPTATVTNVLGQAVETIQYAASPTVSSSSVISGGSPQATSTSYDAAGNRVKVTDPNGNTWNYTYNLLGEQIRASDPDTGTTVTGYDAAGDVAYTTNADGVSVNYEYDQLNRKIAEYTGSTTQGSGTEVSAWVWDTLANGRLSYEKEFVGSATYENGNLGYNIEGLPSGTFVYIPSGQTMAGTYRTQYSYTTTGLLTAMSPAGGGGLPAESPTFTYDKYGNAVTETGYDDYVTGATWNPYGQISQINLGTGPSAASLTYSYDPQTGNVTGINLSDNQPVPQVDNTAYAYNADQQITSVTDTQGGGTGAPVETQCFSYTSLSQLQQAWSSTDSCASNPASAGNATVNGPQPYWQSWTFDPLGDFKTQVSHAPSGSSAGDTTLSYNYGVSGNLHAVSATAASNTVSGAGATTSYGYDATGNTTSATTTGTAVPLISGVKPSSAALCLDDYHSATTAGNKIDIYGCNGTQAQQWTVEPSGLIEVYGNCLDAAGNGTASGTLAVLEPCSTSTAGEIWKAGLHGSWINVNSGLCLDDPSSTTTAGTQVQIYGCDGTGAQDWSSQQVTWTPNGQVATVTSPAASGGDQTVSYLYDADGHELAETTPSGTTLYLPGEELTQATSGTITGMRYYTFAGLTIGEGTATTLYWTEQNTQGSIITAVNADAQSDPVIRRPLSPYGAPLSGGSGTWPDDRTFLNDPASPGTGLVQVGARLYNPALGLFLSVDPVLNAASPLSMAGYTYAAGDPVNSVDPTGLSSAPVSNACEANISYCIQQYLNGGGQQLDGGGGTTTSSYGNTTTTATAGYSCGMYWRLCQKAAVHRLHPGHGPFNVFDWVGHQFRAHWRGIVQTGVFIACLSASAVLCGVVEGGELVGEFVANGIGTHNWGGAAFTLAQGALIDTISAGLGVAGGKMLDEVIKAKLGLEFLDRADSKGVLGKFFGAYKYSGEAGSMARYYPGMNAAPVFGSYLTPGLIQIGFRSVMNEVYCNGTSGGAMLASYC